MHVIDIQLSQYIQIGRWLRELCNVNKTIYATGIKIRVFPTPKIFFQVTEWYLGVLNVLKELLTFTIQTCSIALCVCDMPPSLLPSYPRSIIENLRFDVIALIMNFEVSYNYNWFDKLRCILLKTWVKLHMAQSC